MDAFEEQLRKIEKDVYETKYPALEMEYENTFMNKVRKFFGLPQTVKVQEINPNDSNNRKYRYTILQNKRDV